MKDAPAAADREVAAFRRKFLAWMVLVVATLTAVGLYLAERNVAAETEHDAKLAFDAELGLLQTVRDLRHAALSERCRALVHKPRIHAALEDDALDLLYLSAKDELQDVTGSYLPADGIPRNSTLHAAFYRFLDARGKVIPARDAADVGQLPPADEARINLPTVPHEQQTGCIVVTKAGREPEVFEIIATPIVSTETGDPIAALVVGFKPVEFDRSREAREMKSGVWMEGALYLEGVSAPDRQSLAATLGSAITENPAHSRSLPVRIGGMEHLLFCRQINPGSAMPAVYEVGVYSLSDLLARQQSLRWQVLSAGGVLLLVGLGASFLVSERLERPVRKLAVVSAENLVLRERAEAALEERTEALQRTARFSADASHQLKTPVAVLRAGLDEMLASEELPPRARDEIGMLVHQTFRLTSIIDDLLLLSRLDSARLKLELGAVNLHQMVETCVDDLELSSDGTPLEIETHVPPDLQVVGERRYTMVILQNLFENARKYNRPNGSIRTTSEVRDGEVLLRVANTGMVIPAEARERIFERFHRGGMGETVPGHGLGLNLARELARIHGGDLRLVRSDAEWTEFEVRFLLFQPKPDAPEAA
jgi:signal transduction histidine kinase